LTIMTALTSHLMGTGVPAAQALLLGFMPASAAGVGTAQAGAAQLGVNTLATLTTTAGQTAFRLPANAQPLTQVIARNSSATAALVFPAAGGTINAGAADASVSIAQNTARWFIATGPNTWISFATG
jgi:hypothetical protein